MKNLKILPFILVLLCTKTIAQNPYFVSSNAEALIDTYRDLITITNTDTTCHYDDGTTVIKRRCTFSAMPSKGFFSNYRKKGYVTFTSQMQTYTKPVNEKDLRQFRSSWTNNYDNIWNQYKQCYPNPLHFPFPADSCGLNMNVIFVPVDLAASEVMNLLKAEKVALLTPKALKANEIQAIEDIGIESPSGLINRRIPTAYNNIHSSVGLVCHVLLKTGIRKKCYILNDFDAPTYLVWKVKR